MLSATWCGRAARKLFSMTTLRDSRQLTAQLRCRFCGQALEKDSLRREDGYYTCGQCRATAVSEPQEAERIYQRVVQIMAGPLGMGLNIVPRLAMVDHRQLAELLRERPEASTQEEERVFGFFQRRGRRRTIYVEHSLPQIVLMEILAHEYAHAWQGERCPLLRDPLMREGFAQWAAYHLFMVLGATKKAASLKERTDLYGQGLRLMLALEERGGWEAVWRACQESA